MRKILSISVALIAAAVIFLAVPLTALAASFSVNGVDATVTYTGGESSVLVDSNMYVSDASFADSYIDIVPASGFASGDKLTIKSDADVYANGAISISGSTIYLGNGSTRAAVASIDPTYNGLNGQRMRINFYSSFENGSFESSFDNWTTNNSYIALPGDSGQSDITTSISRVTSDSGIVAPSGSGYFVKMKINGHTLASGTAHGPSIKSGTFSARAGDKVSFKFYAKDSGDDYDVYGYLVQNGVRTQRILYQRGDNTGGWQTVNATIASEGTYQFEFICGTYDATGGKLVGSLMYVDDVQLVSGSVNSGLANSILQHASFETTTSTVSSTARKWYVSARNTSGEVVNSTQGTINLKLQAPTITSVPQSTNQLTVNYSSIANARTYEIWRDGVKIGETGSTSYVDTGRSPNTAYTYKVLAKNSGVDADSSFSSNYTQYTYANAPTISVTNRDNQSYNDIVIGENGNPAGTYYNVQVATNSSFSGASEVGGWGTSLNRVHSGLVAGTTYYYRAVARNSLGNATGYSATQSVTINSSPILTINTPTIYRSAVSGYNTFSLTGTVSDADSDQVTVGATLAGVTRTQTVSATPGGTTWTLTWDIDGDSVPEGTYTGVSVTSVDNSGKNNAGGTAKSWANVLYVDRSGAQAPSVTANENWTNASSVPVTIVNGTDSKQTDAGALKSQYKLSGATTQDWMDYVALSITNKGQTTVQARTIDKVGNIGAVSTVTVKIDRDAPSGSSMDINHDAQYTQTQTVDLTNISASDTGGSGNDIDPDELTRDGTVPQKMQISNDASFSDASSWVNYASAYYNWTLTNGNGDKTVYIRFRDAAGNVSAAISDSIIFDSVKPVVRISQPSQYSVKAGDTVSYTMTIDELYDPVVIAGVDQGDKSKVNLSGAGDVASRIDDIENGITIDGNGQSRTINITLPADLTEEGTVSLQILAYALTDPAGNRSVYTAGNFSFNVDCTPPINQDEIFPDDQKKRGGQAVDLAKTSASCAGGTEGDSVRFAPAGYDGSAPANGTTITSTHGLSSVINAPTEDGEYYLYILDAAGNMSQRSDAKLVVKNQGPVVTLEGPDAAYVRSESTVSFMVMYSSDAAVITLDPEDIGLSRTGTANAYVRVKEVSGAPFKREVELYNLMGDGTITIQIATGSATDTIGNPSAESLVSDVVTVDNIAPVLSNVTFVSDNATNSAYAKKGDTLTLSIESNEPLGGVSVTIGGETVDVSAGNAEKTLWTAQYTVPDYCTLQDGDFPFSIEAADMTGNFCDPVTGVSSGDGVTYDTIVPVIELSGEYDEENGYYTGDVTLTFDEGTSVLTNNSDETISNPVSGTTVSAAGDYTLTVTDIAGNAATVTFIRNGDLLDAVEDRDNLEITYAAGDRADHVTQDLGLPETCDNGSTVSWTVTAGTAVTNAGIVTRPENIDGSQQITLSATVTKGSGSAVKIFNLTVIALPGETDADKAQDDADAASIYYAPGDSIQSVTRDLELADTGVYGSALTWSADAPGLVSIAPTADAGRFAATVTRPTFAEGDKTVTLTAMAALGDETKTQTFELTITRLEGSDADYVKEDAATASITYAGSDDQDNVTQNISFVFNALNGSTVEWLSSDAEVIEISGNSGVVFRPSYEDGNKEVTITANVSKNEETEQITFAMTVICEAGEPDEANQKKMDMDLAALEIGYHNSDSANNVRSHLSLPTLGEYGSVITWSSNNPAISNDGTVSRSDSQEIIVILTATVTNGTASSSKAFMLTVKKKPLTLLQQLGADSDAVELGFAKGNSEESVNQNLTLDTMGANGCTISWSSSDPGVIGDDGVYTSPGSAKTVTLTAAVSKEGYVIYRTFTIKVG